jgi:hypothetical protein
MRSLHPQHNTKMSQTLRLFVNDKRISTAVLTNKGGFLQVFPEKKTFTSEEAWRTSWKHICFPEVRVDTKMNAQPAAVAKGKKQPESPRFNPKEWSHAYTHTYTAPAGSYYIGDLCYALGDDVYDKVFGDVGGYDAGLYTNKTTGGFFLVSGTAYGDGLYRGSDYKEFAVDAGIIGIAPMSLAKKGTEGGHVYTFKEPVKCRFGDGVFRFTSGTTRLVIDTEGNDEKDDDYDY